MTRRRLRFRIVTPSLNQNDFVERAVRSVLEQKGENFDLEYFVFDAVSTDGTLDTLESLQSEFPALQVRVEKDSGQAAAIHKGFLDADADVFAWVNSDDVLLPGCLKRVAEEFLSQKTDVVYGYAWFIDTEDRIIGSYPTSKFDKELLKTFCFFSQPSTFFSASSYYRVAGIDTNLKYALDYDLWLKLSNNNMSFSFVKSYFSATRLSGQTKTSLGGIDFVNEVLDVVRNRVGEVSSEWRTYSKFRALTEKHTYGSRFILFARSLLAEFFKAPRLSLLFWGIRVYWLHLSASLRFKYSSQAHL